MYKALLAFAALSASVLAPGARAGAAQTAANALPSAVTVHVKNFTFEPPSVTIHTGDRVNFVNEDDEAHTVTATDKSFDSEGLDGGQTWQHAFSKAGTYTYYCEMHPYMKAQIVVLAAAADARHSMDAAALNPFASRTAESKSILVFGQSATGSRKSL